MSKDSTREQRKRQLGIDCPDKVVWKNWEAGEEYVKKVVIKNVDVRAQSIIYRLPERKATFLTPYPEAKMLSSGMYMELEIRFCPTEVTEVHDCIEIQVKGRGSFVVYLEALPPHAKLCVPEFHDFELCAVSKSYSHVVTVSNTGTVPLSFYWEAPEPFSIVPSRGELAKDESMELTLIFTPRVACVSVCQAVCKMVDLDDVIATIKVSGIGKYPFVRFQYHHRSEMDGVSKTGLLPIEKDHAPLVPLNGTTSTITFGSVVVGSCVSSEFYLENPSSVPAEVSVRREDDNLTAPFKVSPSSATIPPGCCHKFKVSYRSMSGGSLHVNRFAFTAVAGNVVHLETRGEGIGPKVKCSTNHINFGDVNLDNPLEKDLIRVLQLNNLSNCVARYQFLNTAPGAAFEVLPPIGSIPSKGNVKVKVKFRPTHALNYLRRLIVLVNNSADALYIDVYGSAYDSFIRPLPFDLPLVETFYLRLERGLGRATPDELESLATSSARDCLTPGDEQTAQGIWRDIELEVRGEGKLQHKRTGRLEYHHIFVDPKVHNYPFSMDTTQLSFGGTQPTVQTVTVFNATKAMAFASWCLPSSSVYDVSPSQQDVPPFGRAEFVVRFNSAANSANSVGQYLECFVNFKQMRSFRLCCERSFTPPHCFTVQVNLERGVSSDPSRESGGGSAGSLLNSDSAIFFPAISIGSTGYQVLSIENSGDVVMMYENVKMVLNEVSEKVADDITVYETTYEGLKSASAGKNALDSIYQENERLGGATRSGGPNDIIFTCYPPSGILHPGQHTLMLLKFSPTRYARYEAEAGFRVANMSINDKLSVNMRGESHIPRLVLEEFSTLTFRPTCIKGKSSRCLSILNPSCFPVAYQLFPSPDLEETVELRPESGFLERGQRVWVTATFSPQSARVYNGSLLMIARDDNSLRTPALDLNGAVMREFVTSVPVKGESMHGIVEVEPSVIDLGDIAGLQDQTVGITLYNSGMSELQYEVRTMTRTLPKKWRHYARPPHLRNHTGVLPARSHTRVLITAYPSAGVSEFIFYVIVGGVGTKLNLVSSPPSVEMAQLHPHCLLKIRGTHPAIQIADVRSFSLRRSQLWCQLHINEINHQLSSAVIPSDVQNDGFAFPHNIHNLVPVAMSLGVGTLGSAPSNVSLMIKNTGDCTAQFAFWLPMENDVSVEHWFQDDKELKDIQRVVDMLTIEISPPKGEVEPDKTMVVTISYRYDTVGVHKLPVLLRVNDSKKVLLMLEGRTLPEDVDALAFHHASSYDLLPVALGDVEPPLQSITVENPMEHDVLYQVDTDALRSVAEDNFGFPILQCVNPTGVLAPHSIAQIAWYFRPLESKEYNIEVPITTGRGEKYVLTFTGSGFHPRRVSTDVQREQLEKAFLAIPNSPQVSLAPLVTVALSVDVLQMGGLPYFSLHRRECTITNYSKHHAYSFQWDSRHPTGDHVITVEPISGLLRPGEKLKCRITLYTGSTSQFIEWPLTCHITNESVLEMEAKPGAPVAVVEATREFHLSASTRLPPDETFADDIPEAAKGPFQRTTCTKPCGPRKKAKPVTDIPLTSLGVRGLASKLKAERRRELEFAAAIEDEANEQRSIIYNSLELLLQARIMPIDDYDRVYGNRALRSSFLPVLNAFKDPRGDVTNDALGTIAKEDASLVRDIMDEMLRAIVAHPRVKAAFTDPFIRPTVLYKDCKACRVQPSTVAEGEEHPVDRRSTVTERQLEQMKPSAQDSRNILSGFMGNVMEEALEQLISNVVGGIMEVSS